MDTSLDINVINDDNATLLLEERLPRAVGTSYYSSPGLRFAYEVNLHATISEDTNRHPYGISI